MAITDRCEKIWRWHKEGNHKLAQEATGAGTREISEDMSAELGVEVERAKWTEGPRSRERRHGIYKGMTV